jgi:hypothetical protein
MNEGLVEITIDDGFGKKKKYLLNEENSEAYQNGAMLFLQVVHDEFGNFCKIGTSERNVIKLNN